ncbi:MAG: NAD(P)/FAD-dependent oxidoreductase, partial [Kordiimonas sp.]
YTPWDIMDLLARHGLTWHEKTLGQLFCDQKAGKVLEALLAECEAGGVDLMTDIGIESVSYSDGRYTIKSADQEWRTSNLVIASGGISIPKMGATDFGYKIARQFGLKVVEPLPALVPFTFAEALMDRMRSLAGVSADSIISCGKISFRENLLFTHRGLSGPAILQVSSYWQPGEEITINILPDVGNVLEWLKTERQNRAKSSLKAALSNVLAERLADYIAADWPGNMADLSNKALEIIAGNLGSWTLTPTGTEGFKKAEVTKGGVNTDALSSKTMEVTKQPGLYFIGECVDVTGWLGGYNFQWAWASGHAAGQAV